MAKSSTRIHQNSIKNWSFISTAYELQNTHAIQSHYEERISQFSMLIRMESFKIQIIIYYKRAL